MLSNFQVGERALLQSFLVGQPELRRIMQHHTMQQLRQRVIASYHLGPLDREETERYIEHRLKHVGWSGDPTVQSDAYDAVFAFTSGIPRRINLVCNRLMLSGFLRDSHTLTAADVEVVAQELKEELGSVSRAGTGASDRQDDFDLRSGEPEVGLGGAEGFARAAESDFPTDESLEQRVARLERAVSVVMQMLRKVVRVMEPVARQGGSSSR